MESSRKNRNRKKGYHWTVNVHFAICVQAFFLQGPAQESRRCFYLCKPHKILRTDDYLQYYRHYAYFEKDPDGDISALMSDGADAAVALFRDALQCKSFVFVKCTRRSETNLRSHADS